MLNYCKLQVIFKSHKKLKFQCGLCNESYYGECVRHLAVRSGEHIGISPWTNKRVQLRKDRAFYHHLLNCNYLPTFKNFSVLCPEKEKYLLELKENLLIIRDRPWMNRNIRFVPPFCLNEFLSHCLLLSVDFCDQFFTYFM